MKALVLLLLLAMFTFQEPSSPPVLKSGDLVDRELRPEESHPFRLLLAAGQYVRVAAESTGVDTVLELRAPSGARVAVRDGANPWGVEFLSWVTEESGDYCLEVGAKGLLHGRYKLRLEEVRPSTPQDARFVLGEEAETEAAAWSPATWRSAAAQYEDALVHWRALGDRKREAGALQGMINVFGAMQEWPRALDPAERWIEIQRALGNRRAEANGLSVLARILDELGETQRALDASKDALALHRALGGVPNEGLLLTSIGSVYARLGEFDTALAFYDRALPFTRAGEPPYSEPETLGSIGEVYAKLGDRDRALDAKAQAVKVWRRHGRVGMIALALRLLGETYSDFGEQQRALECFTEALDLYRKSRPNTGESPALTSMGFAYERLGDIPKALELYQQALEVPNPTESVARSRAGAAYAAIGQWDKALEQYRLALPLYRKVSDQAVDGSRYDLKGQADTLRSIGEAHAARGDLVEARQNFEAALEIVESGRSRFTSTELRSAYLASSRRYYDAYIALLMRLHETRPSEGIDALAFGVSERARARTLLDLLAEARVDIRQGADPALVALERKLLSRISALEQRRHTPGSRADARDEEELKTLVLEHEDLEARIRRESPQYAALTHPRPLSLDEIQRQVLDPDTLLFELTLGEEKSYAWAVARDFLRSWELPGRTALEAQARELYALLIARQPLPGESLTQRQRRVRETDAKYREQETAMSRLLLGPVAADIGTKRLLVVADGALQYLPFAALPAPGTGRPLAETREVVHLPSASVLALLREHAAGRSRPSREVAVFADPVFDPEDARIRRYGSGAAPGRQDALRSALRDVGTGLARLPFTRREADAIASLVPRAQSLRATDFEANRERVLAPDLKEYRIVHFATHAIIDNRHPELSGLVLSLVDRDGMPRDGFLRLPEIYNLSLPADLVVLSACSTALGREMKGEGLVGLVRGFMYAGASRVVASLWKVDDEAATAFMTRFYSELLVRRLPPAVALRAAQASMRQERRWASPYYWAAFVLQGDW